MGLLLAGSRFFSSSAQHLYLQISMHSYALPYSLYDSIKIRARFAIKKSSFALPSCHHFFQFRRRTKTQQGPLGTFTPTNFPISGGGNKPFGSPGYLVLPSVGAPGGFDLLSSWEVVVELQSLTGGIN